MTREEWARIKDVVTTALALAPSDRHRQLDAACGSDLVLRREAGSLLDAVVRADGLYEQQPLRVVYPGEGVSWPAVLPPEIRHIPDATMARDQSHEFSGTTRYVVRRCLGVGGMGVVYEVEDRTRHQLVALKTLKSWSPAELYRLKREFRSLADVAHPNLVPLYELEVDGHRCIVTMELVEGRPFVDHVRGGSGADSPGDRVRRCLPQLVAGVQALHDRGLRHGDLKPSNILVGDDGHVSILDFGLATSRTGDGDARADLVGTPAYLSPEQCGGAAISEAGDWYAVGATLYHALAGTPPFDGPLVDLFRPKASDEPRPIRLVAPDVPPDLEAICTGLLRRDPAARWHGGQVLQCLRAGTVGEHPGAFDRHPCFVGRETSLAQLSSAWRRARNGEHVAVYVHGPSGIGKTALLHHFVDAAARETAVVALYCRCHEHESMPYKGLDGVVDGLSRYLRTLPVGDAMALVGGGAEALARLFPVMHGFEGPDTDASGAATDPIALRSRAFAALRDTLARIAGRQPVIVAIDDFHWADAESDTALAALFEAPAPPAVLLLVGFRSEEIDTRPFLRARLERIDHRTAITLPLAPLSAGEALHLLDHWLGPAGMETPADRELLATEAAGHPLLLEELARGVADRPAALRGATLEHMLTRRLDRLPAAARQFLEALAVCGRPIAASRVFEACGLTGDERPLVASLRSAHFVRSSQAPGRVELYHDRLRETLAASVDSGKAGVIHQHIAARLVAHGDDDPEALFEHYRAAGRPGAAAGQAAIAAGRAAAVLAFDRAATLYQHALALDPDAAAAPAWTAGLAAALENAGRPVEAANAYLAAAQLAAGVDGIEWRRKAAELLLVGGRIDHGLAVSADVLAALGVHEPRGAGTSLALLAWRRLRLWLRGLRFEDRPATLSEVERLRIDVCWSISVGLAMVDPLRAAAFNARQLLRSLRAGDRPRIARALALEAGFGAILRIGASWHRSGDLFRQAEALAADDGPPYVPGLAALWEGIGAFLTGRWADATRLCGRAEALLRDRCTGVTWESNLACTFLLYSLLYRGRLRDAVDRLPELLAAARDRGNLYLMLELSTRLSILWLAADEPLEAGRRADAAIGQWEQQGFQRPHYHHLLTLVQVRLYCGEAREAWDILHRHRRALRQRMFRSVQHTRVEIANVRARCALARAAGGDDARHLRAIAVDAARTIARERMPWSDAFAGLILATVAFQDGHIERAAAGLRAAIEQFERADMDLYATAARWRLAGVLGERGRDLRNEAGRWFAGQRVRDPVALTRVLAPGFPDGPACSMA